MRELSEKRANLLGAEGLYNLGKGEPVVVKRKGKTLYALVPLDGQDWESYSLSRNKSFQRILAKSRRRLKKEGGIPIDEVKKMFGIV